jgi:hypothetical protein
MSVISKTLVPNKEWIITEDHAKIGSIAKEKKGYAFLKKGQRFEFKALKEIKEELGIIDLSNDANSVTDTGDHNFIYGYPCSATPFEPVYNVKKKLPLFAKSEKSKCQYGAGYYVMGRKTWVKSFCPKLITLERYPFHGPFKTEYEAKVLLNKLNKL